MATKKLDSYGHEVPRFLFYSPLDAFERRACKIKVLSTLIRRTSAQSLSFHLNSAQLILSSLQGDGCQTTGFMSRESDSQRRFIRVIFWSVLRLFSGVSVS